ncbi:MAG: hypothetical protein EA426_07380 [Spirochaetaceae bacterium]|nr:MAG: hypothetical protein EA426_07380 [Spirochaetaceae bacterium]
MNTFQTKERVETTLEVLERLGIAFSRADAQSRVHEHVSVHKYLLDTERHANHAWDEAVASWNATVLTPLTTALDKGEIKKAFPDKTVGDLYLEASDHWYYLKERRFDVGPDEAADSFALRYGNAFTRFFSAIPFRGLARVWKRQVHRAEVISRNMDRSKTEYDSNLRNYSPRIFV